MKYNTHYEVDYRLVSCGGLARGEIGGMDCISTFSELEDAVAYVNKYQCLSGQSEHLYAHSSMSLDKRLAQSKEGDLLVHLRPPKIWKMNLRGDWNTLQCWQKQGIKPKWQHIEGDSYQIIFEYFNLKTRQLERSRYSYDLLSEAVKALKIKDSKTRLASDFTFYSKSLVTEINI